MNTIYENISKLCELHGITGAKMCKDIGIGKSLMTSLKSGRTKSINAKTAVKIAEYFDVPVGAITGGEGYTRISSRNGVVKVDAYYPPKAKVAAMSAQYDAIRLDQTKKAAPVSESGMDTTSNWLNEADIQNILSQMTPNELAELMGKVALELKGRGLE